MRLILLVILIAIAAVVLLNQKVSTQPTKERSAVNLDNSAPGPNAISQNLDTPWGIAFLPDGNAIITERIGNVRLLTQSSGLVGEPIYTNDKSKDVGEGGLLGVAVHPNFEANGYVYLYYTYSENNTVTLNRVSRYVYINTSFSKEKIIVDRIPGSANHNGGRIKFGPDGLLYITTGDAQNPSESQNKNSLAGKILRVKDDGSIPQDNPFGNAVYSYGHRNPQGITWDDKGNLWETEHGPSGGSLGTGNDEINLIERGKNYGWPTIQGNQTRDGMETPVLNSTPSIAWAPGGVAFANGSLFFGGLRGTALYEYNLNRKELLEHFDDEYGRIRDVVLSKDGFLYFTTSNRDGRGFPAPNDDQIIKIDPKSL